MICVSLWTKYSPLTVKSVDIEFSTLYYINTYTALYCIVLYCTMLYYTILHYTLLYCTVLYCTILYCTMLYYAILYCIILYSTALYCIVLYCIALCCTMLYYTALYSTVLHCTVLYYTVLHYAVLCYTILHYTLLCYTGSEQKQMYSIMVHVCTHKTYVQSAAGVEYERECLRKSLITSNSCLGRNYKCRRRDRPAGREHGTVPPYTHHTSSHKSKA